MKSIDIFIRYSDQNARFEKVATLSKAGSLIYNDEGGDRKAHLKTALKFTALTAASPLISIARLVRAATFIFSGEGKWAGREFIGALATPVIAATCLLGTLLAAVIYPIFSGPPAFYITLRRTYALFEAWVNGIDLKSSDLPSYSQRVSGPMEAFEGRIWVTAPCMQPVLERGMSIQGGLLDPARVQKMFPSLRVNDVQMEQDRIVIQSEYSNESVHYTACNEAYEHRRVAKDFCCCFRVEAVYDRVLCCELSQGNCTSKTNPGDTCGIVSCGCGNVGVCCCYAKEDGVLTTANTGCFGPEGLYYVSGLQRQEASIRRLVC